MTKESMEVDILIIGAGPAGLASAIKLAQLSQEKEKSLSICVIEKSADIGGQILSGAVLDPRALNELLPNWQTFNPPPYTPVNKDQFLFLTPKQTWYLPVPPQMHNKGHFIISLGQFCKWLAKMAEEKGINIFSGFAATKILYENGRVIGIETGDKGVDFQGNPKANFQPGIAILAKQTLFAEGCRGSLSKQLMAHYQLSQDKDPQTYALGIKEIWEVPKNVHQPGLVMHTVGYPLDHQTYGGGFVYHFGENLVSLGYVVGLDYQNPYLSPYEELQRYKLHPFLYPLLENSKRMAYGARTLIEGGLQSLPKLTFPGGMLIGDAAGFLNVPKIKGIHMAMKSGMLAAEGIFADWEKNECGAYPNNFNASWLRKELYHARNIRPAMRFGLVPGLMYAAVDTYLFRGRAPWTLHHHVPDHDTLNLAKNAKKINYPPHDRRVTFDISTSLDLANISYAENQPYHLKLQSRHEVPIDINFKKYDAPETRYCPAGVYEILFTQENKPTLQINGGNCLQCKACDIKDPTQNITWTPSEGGSGPQYHEM